MLHALVFPFPPAKFPLGSPCLSQLGNILLWEGEGEGEGEGDGGRRALPPPSP